MNPEQPILVCITIPTVGTPRLKFTPFDRNVLPVELTLPVPAGSENVSMTLFNAELPSLDSGSKEDTPFDYMLHYETRQQGIGQRLKRPLPGMDHVSITNAPFTGDRVNSALASLAGVVDEKISGGAAAQHSAGFRPGVQAIRNLALVSLNPSCSNSQYP